MKRNILLHTFRGIVLLLCSLTLLACTKKSETFSNLASANANRQAETQPEPPRELTVTASFYPIYIMLMNITENVPGINLKLMAPQDTGCLHHYHLSPADMELIQSTDIMVVNGGHMEEFMDKVLETLDESSIVTAIGDWPVVDHNPHIWVAPAGAIHQVQQIATGLARLDQDNAQLYQDNAANYIAKIQTLQDSMTAQLSPLAGSSMITFHEAFPYFASQFNLNLAGSIQREPDSEPTARELVETLDIIKTVQEKEGKLALFAELNFASSAADVIAAETGLTVYELDPATTGILDKDAYLHAMEYNANVLVQALSN